MAKFIQESLRHCRMAGRTPMTVGKKMSRIGHCAVEIDANMRELAKDRRRKTELRAKKASRALMGQDNPYTDWRLFADTVQNEAYNFDRLGRIQAFRSRLA